MAPQGTPLGLRNRAIFAPMFAACDRLEQAVLDAWLRGGLRTGPRDARTIAWATTMRALKTYDALLALADMGYGEQAGMLCRSLFEDMVVAWWCEQAPSERVADLISEHDRAVAFHFQDAVSKHAPTPGLADLPPLTEGLREAIERREGVVDPRPARRPWYGRLSQLIEEVRLDTDDAERLRRMNDLSNRLNNLLLHHSPFSLNQTIIASGELPDGRTGSVFSRRPSERGVADALESAHYSLSGLAQLIVPADQRARLEALLSTDRFVFARLDPETAASTGRNDPCPCGSGRKFKHCHGR